MIWDMKVSDSSENSTGCESAGNIEMERLALEKLGLEVKALRSPYRRNPALWITTATAIIFGFANLAQFWLSKREFLLAQQRAAVAEVQRQRTMLENERGESRLERLNQSLKEINSSLDNEKRRLDELTKEKEAMKTENSWLAAENEKLRFNRYRSSLTGRYSTMPTSIAIRRVSAEWENGQTLGSDYSDIELILEKRLGADDETTDVFVYEGGDDWVRMERGDYTDHVYWELSAEISSTEGETIRISGEKNSGSAAWHDDPLGGYQELKDGQGREYLLIERDIK